MTCTCYVKERYPLANEIAMAAQHEMWCSCRVIARQLERKLPTNDAQYYANQNAEKLWKLKNFSPST